MFSSVDLPLPDGPSSTMNSPRRDVEVDVAQRVHGRLAGAVGLAQGAGRQHAVAHGRFLQVWMGPRDCEGSDVESL